MEDGEEMVAIEWMDAGKDRVGGSWKEHSGLDETDRVNGRWGKPCGGDEADILDGSWREQSRGD